MAEYDNRNRGVLFKGKKEQENHPDYEGSINIEGTDYWLSAWLKKSKAGQTFMSLSVKPKQASKPSKPGPVDLGEDVPF